MFENAINTNILKPNYEYSETEILKSIFNKNYINSSDELDEKERLISYIKYKNIINDLKGSIELENKQGLYTKIITKIPMDIIFVKGLVFNEGKSTYVINKDLVEDIFEFNSENIINLNGLQYYKYENKNREIKFKTKFRLERSKFIRKNNKYNFLYSFIRYSFLSNLKVRSLKWD